ncbi:MAG: hypothetical protein JWL90_1615 [Chthoniobacteraceae bacterium]|nr:hypothetical protein [Chthoniobacteraceae bacterium]
MPWAFAGESVEPGKTMVSGDAEKASRDLFLFESKYTGGSNFERGGLGEQDAFSTSFAYGHRFRIAGQWFLRTGIGYERTDFGASRAPVPTKLQAFSGTLAVEYVMYDYAGAALELHPGFYFENEIRGRSFDIPWDLFVTIPITKKLYGVVGAAGAAFYSYPVIPIFGAIWLISDKVRLEAIFPKASLVYNQSDDWEFRIVGEAYGGGFRVDRTPATDPRLRDAVVQYEEFRVGAQATYSHFKPFDLVIGAGYNFERNFDFHRVGEEFKTEGAPFVRVAIEAKF